MGWFLSLSTSTPKDSNLDWLVHSALFTHFTVFVVVVVVVFSIQMLACTRANLAGGITAFPEVMATTSKMPRPTPSGAWNVSATDSTIWTCCIVGTIQM